MLLLIKIFHTNLSMSYSPFSACNEVHKSAIGSIKSLNFPNDYPNDAKCRYLIMNADPEARITINFLHFDLYQYSWKCDDSVKIYDGNSTKATQIGRTDGYCGKRAPPSLTIRSTRNSLLIVFYSNSYRTSTGFNAAYTGRIVLIYFIFKSVQSTLSHLQSPPEWRQSQRNYGSFLSKSDLHGTILYTMLAQNCPKGKRQ